MTKERVKVVLCLDEEDERWCVADEDQALSNCYTAYIVRDGNKERGQAYLAAYTLTPESSVVSDVILVFKHENGDYEAYDLDEVEIILANDCDEEE